MIDMLRWYFNLKRDGGCCYCQMDPLVEKTLELRKAMYEKEEKRSKKGDPKARKTGGADSIQDSLSDSVRTLALFFGFHDIDASALASLTAVVSRKLETLARQLAILERRKADRLPQPYSSPLLHVLVLNGIPSYQSLGVYYERRVRATYEQVKARADAQLSQQKEPAPAKRRRSKKEVEEEEEEYQYLGVGDVVAGASDDNDENENAPKKRRKTVERKKKKK